MWRKEFSIIQRVTGQGGAAGPLLVRRKGPALPAELDLGGVMSPRIDWCRSTLLNLVVQTSYRLTVAACRHVPLHRVAGAHDLEWAYWQRRGAWERVIVLSCANASSWAW